MESFPTTDAEEPLVIADLPTLELMRFAVGRQINFPDEWWIQTTDGQADAVAATLRAAPLTAVSADTVDERTRILSADPVALGIIGALSVGFVVAALFAVIGLAISAAVSARQRRTEFALLRALGLSGRELSGWLWLENTAVVTVSLAAGTVMGLVIGWVVLPFVTVTQAGDNPFPPVLLEVPWGAIALLGAAGHRRAGNHGARAQPRAAPLRHRIRAADGGGLSHALDVGRRLPASPAARGDRHCAADRWPGGRHQPGLLGGAAAARPRLGRRAAA